MTDFVRPEIAAMQGYVPGEQPPPGKFIKLNTNENPYPPSPAVVRAIAEAAERGSGTLSGSAGDGLSHAGRAMCWVCHPTGFCAATAATTS